MEDSMKFISRFLNRYQALAEVFIDVTLMIIVSLCVCLIYKEVSDIIAVLSISVIIFCLYVAVRKDIIREELTKKGEYGDKE
jgi:hypothetical protein